MDRRRFVELGAGVLAAAALPGCAAVVATPVTPVAGVVRLVLRNYPQLDQPGGYLKILPAGESSPLYVLALGGNAYAVVSSICTHLQCTVNVEGAQLICPCHGSTFDRTGRVLRGPAQQALRRVPASVDAEGILQIRLGGET